MPCLVSLHSSGTSLAAQWLRLHASNARVMGSIPDLATKIPHAAWSKTKTKTKKPLLLMEKSAWSWQWRPHSLVPLWLSRWIRLSPLVRLQTESLLFPGRVKKGMWMPKSQCQNSLHLVAVKGERKSWGSFSDVNCSQEMAMLPFTPSSLEPAQTLNGPHSTAQHVVWQSWAHSMAFSGAQDLTGRLPGEQGRRVSEDG